MNDLTLETISRLTQEAVMRETQRVVNAYRKSLSHGYSCSKV
jgi:hypothetical protein